MIYPPDSANWKAFKLQIQVTLLVKVSDSKNISEVSSDLVAIYRESIRRGLFNITFIIISRYVCAWLFPTKECMQCKVFLFVLNFIIFIFYTAGSYQLSILYKLVYTCQSQSPSSSHHSPCSYFPPLVSIHLFSTSVSLFLPCKPVHLYHFSRFHIYALTYDICFSLSDLLHSV